MAEVKIDKIKDYEKGVFLCQRCGWCRTSTHVDRGIDRVCPMFEYHPDYAGWDFVSARGRVAIIRAILEGEVEIDQKVADLLYQCAFCGNCREVCGMNVAFEYGIEPERRLDHIELYEGMRQHLREKGFIEQDHNVLITSLKNYGNPWLLPRASRTDWIKQLKKKYGIEVKDASKEKVDVLYYVGCTAAMNPELRQTVFNTARILDALGLNWGALGKAEVCCAGTVRRIGAWDLFSEFAKENMDIFEKTGAKTLVFACPGCRVTMLESYDKFGDLGKFELKHITQMIAEGMHDGRVKFTKEIRDVVATYHDPCHLGRQGGVIDEPREILNAIPGLKFLEYDPHGRYSICCGAGGGVKTAFNDVAQAVAKAKLEKSIDMGANRIVSSCPFCETNFREAIKGGKYPIQYVEMVDLVVEAMGLED